MVRVSNFVLVACGLFQAAFALPAPVEDVAGVAQVTKTIKTTVIGGKGHTRTETITITTGRTADPTATLTHHRSDWDGKAAEDPAKKTSTSTEHSKTTVTTTPVGPTHHTTTTSTERGHPTTTTSEHGHHTTSTTSEHGHHTTSTTEKHHHHHTTSTPEHGHTTTFKA